MCGVKQGTFVLPLHYLTYPTHISTSESLIITLTMRHGGKCRSEPVEVRPEGSGQVQSARSPELSFWRTVREATICSNTICSGLEGAVGFPEGKFQLCRVLSSHDTHACLTFHGCKTNGWTTQARYKILEPWTPRYRNDLFSLGSTGYKVGRKGGRKLSAVKSFRSF